jgi:hypothetical protein
MTAPMTLDYEDFRHQSCDNCTNNPCPDDSGEPCPLFVPNEFEITDNIRRDAGEGNHG